VFAGDDLTGKKIICGNISVGNKLGDEDVIRIYAWDFISFNSVITYTYRRLNDRFSEYVRNYDTNISKIIIYYQGNKKRPRNFINRVNLDISYFDAYNKEEKLISGEECIIEERLDMKTSLFLFKDGLIQKEKSKNKI
jgi:hypothetical protein